jgi:hypothetical protein
MHIERDGLPHCDYCGVLLILHSEQLCEADVRAGVTPRRSPEPTEEERTAA